jgi:hypothetical protein
MPKSVMPRPAPKQRLPDMVGVRKPYRMRVMAGTAFMMANRSLACRTGTQEDARTDTAKGTVESRILKRHEGPGATCHTTLLL